VEIQHRTVLFRRRWFLGFPVFFFERAKAAYCTSKGKAAELITVCIHHFTGTWAPVSMIILHCYLAYLIQNTCKTLLEKKLVKMMIILLQVFVKMLITERSNHLQEGNLRIVGWMMRRLSKHHIFTARTRYQNYKPK
jgi:hypothetical protein